MNPFTKNFFMGAAVFYMILLGSWVVWYIENEVGI